MLQIRPNMMVVYPYTIYPDGRMSKKHHSGYSMRQTSESSLTENFKGKQAYSGQLTPHSRKRLQKTINLLVAVSQPKRVRPPLVEKAFTFKVNFVTLTLPAAQRGVSDKDIKSKCLDNWIKAMRRKHQLKSYVWRAERQYNGNIHFHITTDTFLPQDDIRNEWNRQLSKFHFIDEFRQKHGYSTPNSTDVHAVWKIKNIASYMVKYMSKNADEHLRELNATRISNGEQAINPDEHPFQLLKGQPAWNDPINGKVWDCSQNLKAKDRCEIEAEPDIQSELNKIVFTHQLRFIHTEYCTLIFSGEKPMESILKGVLLHLYLSYLNRIRCY